MQGIFSIIADLQRYIKDTSEATFRHVAAIAAALKSDP